MCYMWYISKESGLLQLEQQIVLWYTRTLSGTQQPTTKCKWIGASHKVSVRTQTFFLYFFLFFSTPFIFSSSLPPTLNRLICICAMHAVRILIHGSTHFYRKTSATTSISSALSSHVNNLSLNGSSGQHNYAPAAPVSAPVVSCLSLNFRLFVMWLAKSEMLFAQGCIAFL